ncbi:hypothetical protein ABQE89_16655 [Mycolicibacterium sp. XJ1819]
MSAPIPKTSRLRAVVLALLAVDGVLSAIAGTFFLQLYIGSVPFPISALICGVVNAALVWAALQWTSELPLAGLPLWSWLLTLAVLALGGPGDDIAFGGVGIMGFAPLLLIALGTLLPAAVLWRHVRA